MTEDGNGLLFGYLADLKPQASCETKDLALQF
jgi:hypothetical protein